MRYCPVPSVRAVRIFSVNDGLAASTVTPGSTAPDESLTTPAMVAQVTGSVPEPRSDGDERALKYMGLEAGTPMQEIALDRVFIGSCTNSRIGDLRAAAEVVKGRTVASTVNAMVVPGSQQVAIQAEREGLDEVFRSAGFEWRESGCSACLGMNPDILQPGERCASTSNRNFEGRQGKGGRTHLVSPLVAAATAVRGTLSSPADLDAIASDGTLITGGAARTDEIVSTGAEA